MILKALFLEPCDCGVSIRPAEVTGFFDFLEAFAPLLAFRFELTLQALLPASIVSTGVDHNGAVGSFIKGDCRKTAVSNQIVVKNYPDRRSSPAECKRKSRRNLHFLDLQAAIAFFAPSFLTTVSILKIRRQRLGLSRAHVVEGFARTEPGFGTPIRVHGRTRAITGPNHATNELADSTDQVRPAWFGSGCMATLYTNGNLWSSVKM